MKKTIDITTTATLRPEIFKQTLSEFWDKIFSKYDYNYKLIINVDPIGEKNYLQEDIVNVAKKYFSDIIYNFPNENSFPKAVKWVWSNTSSDYVFHLEDMWNLFATINMDHLVHILDNYPKIASINLFKYVISDGAPYPNFYKYLNNKDKRLFLQIRDPLLSPGLYRGNFVRKISEIMNNHDNPELQIWRDKEKPNDKLGSLEIKNFISNWDYAIYSGNWKLPFWRCAVPTVSMRQGRKWKKEHGFYKKTHFTPWEKI